MVEDLPVTLELWDTAGLERFRSMVCLVFFPLQPYPPIPPPPLPLSRA
jgi:hypothetical protein